ncbi:lamin tail domain-containing protein [Pseudolysobacter antarcticus]|nr:lamin tail domain-containing protein [Pseudolysobacter antarcticus]
MFGKYIRSLAVFALLATAMAGHAQVVISQVYGGGGNTGATFTNDFIEVFNRGSAAVDINGWSVQYASSAGTTWAATTLASTSTMLQPGQYYLVQEASGGAVGAALPAADATGGLNLSATNGKVALVNTSTALTGASPTGSAIQDLVGFGTATFFEGSGAAAAGSNTTALIRAAAGCTDTNSNSADFAVATPTPRNRLSTLHVCGGGGGPTNPSATGAASPTSVLAGNSTLLTVSVTPGGTPTSTGLAVTVNLTAIGGSANQTFYDDGSNGDTTPGDNVFSYNATVAGATSGGSKSLTATITDAQSRSATAPITLTVTTPPVTIMQIQGHGGLSPLAGSTATTTGTVTAVGTKGFFIQDPTGDNDVTTSDAVYVFINAAPTVVVGNSVTVTATVSDYQGSTELSATLPSIVNIVNNGAGVVPSAVVLDNNPPSTDPTTGICANPAITVADGLQANNFACLDGMLVTMNDAIVTGATFGTGSDGVHQGLPSGFYATLASQPRPYRAVGAAWPGLGGSIPVWNGEPEILEIYYNGLAFPSAGYIYNAGTRFSVTGVIQGYQGAYEMYPITMTTNTAIPAPTYPQPVKDSADGTLTIGTQNMLHFFNATADGADTSTYTDSCAGTGASDTCPTPAQYAIRLQKMSKQIREVLKSPIALGVEEIENYSTLTDLKNRIYTDSGNTLMYQQFTMPGNDLGGINLGILVRNDVVVHSVTQMYKGTTTSSCSSGASCLLNDRPPVLLDATFNGYHFNLLVIYDRSLINLGVNDYVGKKRTEQAVQIASIVQALQSGGTLVGAGNAQQDSAGVITSPGPFNITGDVNVPLIVVGDFNAYEFTDGYVDVTGMITGAAVQAQNKYWDLSGTYVAPSPTLIDTGIKADPTQRYSYNFSGYAQEIDHVLLSRRGWKDFVSVSNAHGNSDVSEAGITGTTPIVLDASTAAHSSDHDGQVLTIAIDRIFADGLEAPPQ